MQYFNLKCSLRPVQLSAGGDDVQGRAEATGTAAGPAETEGAGNPFDPDDPGPYPIHGVVIPENGLTFGEGEVWTYWPEDVGRAAEGQVQGRNIVELHPDEVTNDDVIGEVTDEAYIPGVGLSWTGETDSRERAKQVHRGRLDSSPYLYAHDGGDAELPDDAPDGTRVASGVSKIRDIGLVPDGAIEGSEVSAGPHPGIEGDEAIQTALSEGFGRTYKPEDDESDGMGNEGDNGGDGDADADLEELRARIEALEDERDTLEAENEKLRRPYLEAVTDGTDLSPEAVNMDADALATYFEGEGEEGEGPSAGEGGEGGEEATALSAAPLTAQRGSPPGRATALSEGNPEGSDGEGGASEVEVPDESLDVLEKRRDAVGTRGTEEYREKLDAQIEAKRKAVN